MAQELLRLASICLLSCTLLIVEDNRVKDVEHSDAPDPPPSNHL